MIEISDLKNNITKYAYFGKYRNKLLRCFLSILGCETFQNKPIENFVFQISYLYRVEDHFS